MTTFATYFPFTGGPAAAEADWGLFAQLWATDGVVRGADSELVVQAHTPANLTVEVLSGQVWAQGYFGRIGTTTSFALTGADAPDAGFPRRDLVVARFDFGNHRIDLLYRRGVASASPTPPALVHSAGLTWDIGLAEIAVAAGASSITAANITDRRPVSTAGGVTRAIPVTATNPLVIENIAQVPQGFIVVVPVLAGVGFNTITAPTALNPVLILEFGGTLQVTTDTGNLRLERNLVTGIGTLLVLEWDGTVWREISRANEVVVANTVLAGPPSGSGGRPQSRFLVADDFPTLLWSTLAPLAISQGAAVGFSVDYARYFRLGKMFVYSVKVTITSATGISGQNIMLGLPFALTAPLGMALGTFRIDSAASYHGVVELLVGTTDIGFVVPTLGGAGSNPAFALGIGDLIKFSISGEQV